MPPFAGMFSNTGFTEKAIRDRLAILLADTTGSGARLADELYAYLDDTHVDTALRRIVRPLRVAIAA